MPKNRMNTLTKHPGHIFGRWSCLLLLTSILFSCKQKHDDNHIHDHGRTSYSDFGPYLFPSKHPDQIILNLTKDPINSVAVNWRTDTTISGGRVQIGEATHGPEFRDHARTIMGSTEIFSNQYGDEPKVVANFHSAIIDNLISGMIYVYRVGIDTSWSEWFQIKVPDVENDGVSFIYFGDAQNEVKSMWSRVIRKAYSTMPNVDFLLHAGDLINRSNRDLEWAEWFYAGSFIHATIPSIMTPGNHEYSNVVLSPHWRPQFALPSNGPKGLEETCYQINYPDLKIVSLDAEQMDESEFYSQAQVSWLDSILLNDPRTWHIITLHYPLYSTKPDRDNPELRAALKPVIDKHKVDIVLQGHDHAYGRGTVTNEDSGMNMQDEKSGTVYVVSVSGPKMYDVGEKAWMDRRANNTQLYQIIKIKDQVLNYTAYTALGDIYDAFDILKSSKGPNKVVNRIPKNFDRIQ